MFQRIRNHRFSMRLASGLALLLIVQLLIPLQAHSRIDRDAQGLTVVICTLDGLKQARIRIEGPENLTGGRSAAMAFSDLLLDLSPVLPVPPEPAGILTWGTVLPIASLSFGHTTHSVYRSRDPPHTR